MEKLQLQYILNPANHNTPAAQPVLAIALNVQVDHDAPNTRNTIRQGCDE